MDVGITEYIFNQHFTGGVVKHRISDFTVNQIGPDGNVVTLTDQTPQIFQDFSQQTFSFKSQEDIEAALSVAAETLSQQQIAPLRLMLSEKLHGNGDMIVQLDCPASKQDRRAIHAAVKSVPTLHTSTCLDTNKIKVFFENTASKKRKSLRLDDRKKRKPPSKVVEFVMQKTNVDTMQALKQISKKIGVNTKFLAVAGNKDKRGNTTQRVTILFNNAQKISKMAPIQNIKIGNFRFVEEALRLGDLWGNRFTLIIRSINELPVELIQEKFESLRTRGFVNYFGLQRFGNADTHATHKIGLCILKQDYQAAVNMILAPRETFNQREAEARVYWEQNQDLEGALKLFPHCCVLSMQHVERNILEGMIKGGGENAYYNGIMALPRNGRTLYTHAYQSYIWNMAVSRRLQMGGDISNFYAVAGDLVLDGTVRVVSSENIEKYGILDVVLPLPGSEVRYPENLQDFYEELLGQDGVSLGVFAGLHKAMALNGDYRKILSRPVNMQWELISYGDIDQQEPGDGPIRALRVAFSLGSSCYATICMRELTGLNKQFSDWV